MPPFLSPSSRAAVPGGRGSPSPEPRAPAADRGGSRGRGGAGAAPGTRRPGPAPPGGPAPARSRPGSRSFKAAGRRRACFAPSDARGSGFTFKAARRLLGRAAGWRRWDPFTAAGPSETGREPESEREPARAGGAGPRGPVGPGAGSSRAHPRGRGAAWGAGGGSWARSGGAGLWGGSPWAGLG